MHNKVESFDVTAQLKLLQSQAQLSNAVSCQALKAAVSAWSAHQAKYDYERKRADVIAIKRHLNLIVSQVNNRATRINPLMWCELLKINSVISFAIINDINLEPRTMPAQAVNVADIFLEMSYA